MKFIFTILLALACFGLAVSAQTLSNYQAKVLGQSPSSYFTFDGGSLASIAGSPVTLSVNPSTVAGQFNYDVFNNATNSIYFTASSDAAYDQTHHLISGGGTATTNSTAAGSITLLFRTIDPGPPPSGAAGQHYIFSAGGSAGTSNTLALLIENPTSPDPLSIKLRFGDSSTTLLQSNNIVPDAWYYFALTYNEASTNSNGTLNTNKARWYLGRLGGGSALVSGTTVSNDVSAVAGDGADFFIGSQTTFSSGFRNPGDGRVDELAIWNRELTANEIQAQFTNLPNVALPPAAKYQNVITNQSPSHYFKLDGNPADSINGSVILSTNSTGTALLGYSYDYFGTQPGACYISGGAEEALKYTSLLNGGGTYNPGASGTGKGSISCLFHPLAGTNYTGQKFIFSAGGSTGTSNGFALYFENISSSANPLALKVRFGDSTDVALPVTNFMSEWYYFAMTYDETRTNKQVNWWLARPGTTLQTGFFSAISNSLAGAGNFFCIGNDASFASGFRAVNSGRSSNGQVDEFAIWNRVLTTNEVAAQFSALSVSAGPPPVLNISVSGTNAILSWLSSTDSGYALQSATNLAAPIWTGAGAAVVVGANYVVTNAISGSAQFYRLTK
jgi:hypothetical protein